MHCQHTTPGPPKSLGCRTGTAYICSPQQRSRLARLLLCGEGSCCRWWALWRQHHCTCLNVQHVRHNQQPSCQWLNSFHSRSCACEHTRIHKSLTTIDMLLCIACPSSCQVLSESHSPRGHNPSSPTLMPEKPGATSQSATLLPTPAPRVVWPYGHGLHFSRLPPTFQKP